MVLNTLINVYRNNDQEWASGELIYLDDFLTNQIQEKEQELAIVENRLKEFQEEENIFGLSGNADLILNELIDIESNYFQTQAERNIVSKRKEFLSCR